jgi:GNAT superfamily N-acetyltransferase
VIKTDTYIRRFDKRDIPEIAGAFAELGWDKAASQYERYLIEQAFRVRDVYIARVDDQFSGYLTISWRSGYRPFRERNIPEIMDFNVLPKFRRQGIGSLLMDRAESEIAKESPVAGIGVGMTPDYGAAQKLYALRGYIPDGNGLYYLGRPVVHGQAIKADDNLVLYLTKELRSIDLP